MWGMTRYGPAGDTAGLFALMIRCDDEGDAIRLTHRKSGLLMCELAAWGLDCRPQHWLLHDLGQGMAMLGTARLVVQGAEASCGDVIMVHTETWGSWRMPIG